MALSAAQAINVLKTNSQVMTPTARSTGSGTFRFARDSDTKAIARALAKSSALSQTDRPVRPLSSARQARRESRRGRQAGWG